MHNVIVDGLSLIDPIGRAILATTVSCLLAAIAANAYARRRYVELRRDLDTSPHPFRHALLNRIVGDAVDAAQRGSGDTQAIIEERFHSELRAPLLAERFVRAATGLVIILGLLGTFYGLTLSIGRIVRLVSADVASADVTSAVTTGLTHALSGMAVAFANSLVGILSAVILTVLNVFSNVTDRRLGVMLRLETCVGELLAHHVAIDASAATPSGRSSVVFRDAIARLEAVVARFESSLTTFTASSREFHEFNAHLKDNIQRMSLSFGDFSDTLKGQVGALKARDGR